DLECGEDRRFWIFFSRHQPGPLRPLARNKMEKQRCSPHCKSSSASGLTADDVDESDQAVPFAVGEAFDGLAKRVDGRLFTLKSRGESKGQAARGNHQPSSAV